MKRFLCAAVLVAMILGTTGCGGGTSTDASSAVKASSATESADAGEVVKLEVFAMPSNTSGTWEGWSADIIRKKIGVEVELLPSGDQGEQKLQALMASGELPDVVVFKENTQVINAVAGDMLLAYDDYKSSVPHIYENASASLRYYADNVSGGKGKAYSVGSNVQTEIETKGSLNWGPVLRYDLYKQIGSPAIKTYEDYLPVLKKMQEVYPTNAEGQKVYAFSLWKDWDRSHLMLGHALGAVNGVNIPNEASLIEIDHTQNNLVRSLLAEDSWYLKCIRMYYEANQMGLMDPDSLTQRFDDAQTKGTAGRTLFSWWAWATGSFNTQEVQNEGKGFMQVMAENTKVLHQGVCPTGKPWSWSVSKSTKYPEKAMAFVDAMYDPDIQMELVNGPKGVVWDVDENNNPRILEDGYKYLLDTTLELPGGNNMAKDTVGTIFNAQGLHGTFVMKDYNNNQLGSGMWPKPDYAPADTKLVDMWQEDYGAEDQIQYLSAKNAIAVAPFVNYPVFTDEMEQISARVGDVIKTQSWKMVFAKDDAEYEALKEDMIKKAEGMGINDFVKWYTDAYAEALKLASNYKE